MLDLATLTGAMSVALGAGATGTFTNSTQLWTGENNNFISKIFRELSFH